jgi:tetratricopeptide (TPR) repeat protein
MEESPNKAIPFEKHPLYQEAMEQIKAGDKQAAVATLERLCEQYPHEQFLQDLLVRVQLQTQLGGAEYIAAERSQGTPILRTLVMVMLAITTCLVVAVGVIGVANARKGDEEQQALVRQVNAGWDEVDRLKQGGDLIGMRQELETLAALKPDDSAFQQEIQQALAEVDRLKWCADTFGEAGARENRGDYQGALDLYIQITPDCSQYDEAQAAIERLKKLDTVETAWMEARSLFDAGDYSGAIVTLNWIREQDADFNREQVESMLFEAHRQLGFALLDGARGNVEAVDEAGTHFAEALKYRYDQELATERRLAVGYVAGYQSYQGGDYVAAVVKWEPQYAERPDYQNGVLEDKLYESYPLAARQLIAEANGSVMRLTQAVDYLDQALAKDPANEELEQERTLAVEFLAGQEAYSQADYVLAISHWGPISAEQPDYQNGTLEERLRESCSLSTAPDEQYCTP